MPITHVSLDAICPKEAKNTSKTLGSSRLRELLGSTETPTIPKLQSSLPRYRKLGERVGGCFDMSANVIMGVDCEISAQSGDNIHEMASCKASHAPIRHMQTLASSAHPRARQPIHSTQMSNYSKGMRFPALDWRE